MFVSLQLCVRAMASLETIGPLLNGMKKRSDIVGIACETLNRMFQKEQTDLVAQVSSTFPDCKNVVFLYLGISNLFNLNGSWEASWT